jgi:ABC-type phosphate transport system substrate-binding protein
LIKRLLKKAPFVAALGLVVMMATAGASQATVATQVTGQGSDTTYFMMVALGDMYNSSPGCNPLVASGSQTLDGGCPQSANENQADFVNYFHDFAVERWPIGSGGGINTLCQKGTAGVVAINFARSSRVPQDGAHGGTDCAGLKFVGYAKDGITWECFPSAAGSGCNSMPLDGNSHRSMTIATLKGIFVNCGITNWSNAAVGGANVPIDVYVDQKNSGTSVSWASALGVTLAPGDTLSNCIPVAARGNPGQPGSQISFENVNDLIHLNGDEANAIFPFSVGVFHFKYGPGFTGSDSPAGVLNDIGGVAPTDANILSGAFSVNRLVFNVVCTGTGTPKKCGTSTPASVQTTKFVGPTGFICKNEGKFNDSHGNPILNPNDGNPYRGAPSGSTPTGDIPDAISAAGFVPLPKQGSGASASYCISQPLTSN